MSNDCRDGKRAERPGDVNRSVQIQKTMSARDAVLSNRDLTRQIIGHSAATLLQTSHSQRDPECGRLYELWTRSGCPRAPADALEQQCLAAQGGLTSRLCRGVWHLRWRDGESFTDVDGARVARGLAQELTSPEKSLVLTLGSTTLQCVRSESTGHYVITVTVSGWRRRGPRCLPSPAQLVVLLDSVCTATGSVPLPCPPGGSAPSPVNVPRRITAEVRWGGAVELTATRQ